MPRKHSTILHDRVPLNAGATALDKDLPINPISFLTLALRLLNNGANAIPTWANILATIGNVEVLLDGKHLVQGSLTDLAALTYALWGTVPTIQPISKTDNNILNAVIQIPFGRRAWDPVECLPTARKGDLVVRLTPAAAFTGLDTLTVTLEARQVLDATPERFLKYYTKTFTPPATGPNDLDITTGPDYLGLLLFATTVPTAASQNASIASLSLRIDEVEQYYPATRWEALWSEWHVNRPNPFGAYEHTHISDLAAAYTQFQNTGAPSYDDHLLNNYAYLDFDPIHDLTYRLITRGRSRFHLVLTADVADAVRAMPVELVPLVEPPPGT